VARTSAVATDRFGRGIQRAPLTDVGRTRPVGVNPRLYAPRGASCPLCPAFDAKRV